MFQRVENLLEALQCVNQRAGDGIYNIDGGRRATAYNIIGGSFTRSEWKTSEPNGTTVMCNDTRSDRLKVEKLLKAIRCTAPELIAANVFVERQHGHNFVDACGYFSQQVSRVHGPAQLEYRQSKSRKQARHLCH
jgi:hypothetical protein